MPGTRRIALDEHWTMLAGVVQTDGTYLAKTAELGADEVGVVDALYLSSDPPTSVTCDLYHDDVTAASWIERSVSTTQDAFEGEIEIPGGSALVLSWSGVTGTPTLRARMHLRRYRVVAVATP